MRGTILSYAQAKAALAACVRTRRVGLLVGPPGVGKTSMAREIAQDVGLPLHVLIGSNCDAVDIAGLPWVEQGRLLRSLYPEIQACVDAPGILFLDELTTVPPSVQAPLMRLLLERNAGGTALHPESVVLAACNAPEHAPSAVELSAATVNRVIRLVYAPTLDEVRGYFDRQDPATAFGAECRDFAATLAHEVGLLQLDPPQASVDAGLPWGSPRAWELGLDVYAAHGTDDDVGLALLGGAVGDDLAIAYLAIKKLRVHLPSIEGILKNPTAAEVPAEKTHQVAALGVLSRVADTDVWAAWAYADRLVPEIGAAAARVLMNRAPQGASKHAQAGKAGQIKLLAKIKRATSI